MNVYVESNFVLELTLLQEEAESCERILSLCEAGQAKLFLPAYSFAEPHETLKRSAIERSRLAEMVNEELKRLARSTLYKDETKTTQVMVSLFTGSSAEEQKRFTNIRDRLLRAAEIIPLDSAVLTFAAACEQQYRLSPQDAIVFASVLQHLNAIPPSTIPSCFVDRDRHFTTSSIKETLGQYNCKILFNFNDGYGYLQSQI